MKRESGLTLIDSVVVLIVLSLAISLAAAGLDFNQVGDVQLRSAKNQRDIIQSMTTYASGNNNRFPGVMKSGEEIDISASGVFQILLNENHITGEQAINPMEDIEPWQKDQKVTTEHISYAILDIHIPEGRNNRLREWRPSSVPLAVVLSDRNTGTEDGYASVYTPFTGQEKWAGDAGRSDGHVSFEISPVVTVTKYGSAASNDDDHLFESNGDSDALMTFFKDEDGKEKPIAARPVPQVDDNQSE